MGGEVTYFTKATSTTKLISIKLPIITQKIIQNKKKKYNNTKKETLSANGKQGRKKERLP